MPTLARAAVPGIARRGTRRLLELQPLGAYLDDLLALTAVVLAMAGAHAIPVVPLIAIAMLRLSFRGFTELRRVPINAVGPTGSSVLPRILGVLGLTALFTAEKWGWVATFVVLTILLTEMLLPRIESLAVPYVQNVPGTAVRNAPRLPPKRIFAINVIGVTVFGIAMSTRSSVAMVSVALVMLLPTLNVAVDASLRLLARHRSEPRLSATIAGCGPTFVLCWDARAGRSTRSRRGGPVSSGWTGPT